MERISFICGGKTGDLNHYMMIVKLICEIENKKADLYLTNDSKYGGDKFHFSIEKTFQDLKPYIKYQNYVNSFQILIEDISHLNPINLNTWRSSPDLYRMGWIDLLSNFFKVRPKKEPWLQFHKNIDYSDSIIIHRSVIRHIQVFPWEKIVKNNECTFIVSDENIIEYDMFPFKENVKLHLCKTFSEMVEIINSCKFFIGNMSTPLAIAHSLGKPHLGELNPIDDTHYIGDQKYIENFFYINNFGLHNLSGITNFINI